MARPIKKSSKKNAQKKTGVKSTQIYISMHVPILIRKVSILSNMVYT